MSQAERPDAVTGFSKFGLKHPTMNDICKEPKPCKIQMLLNISYRNNKYPTEDIQKLEKINKKKT